MKRKSLCSIVMLVLAFFAVSCGKENAVPEATVEEQVQETETESATDEKINAEDVQKQEMAELMLQNLELEEYLGESIQLIGTEEWFQTMDGEYTLEKDGTPLLIVQTGTTQKGEKFSKVSYLGEETKVLRKKGEMVQLLRTGMVDGKYQGPFESWTLDGDTGDIYYEKGTLGNGVLTGDYTISIHEGTEGSEVYSLWSHKEGMKYTTYNGQFNEQGISTLKQPNAEKLKALIKDTEYTSCIVYAIDVNDCLFWGLKEGENPESFVFGIEKLGWDELEYQRERGTLPRDKEVTKPNTQKPIQQQPQQNSGQQETQQPESQPSQQQKPQQQPPQESTPPANSGGSVGDGSETDVEWTPDIL